jgi:hypothetical protein
VEAIKLDKVRLGPQLEPDYVKNNLNDEFSEGKGTSRKGKLSKADDKLIEDNMDEILKRNVIQDDEDEKIAEGDGLLVDNTLLRNLDEAGKKSGKKKGGVLDDYKSTKKKGSESKSRTKKSDILADMTPSKSKGKSKGSSSKIGGGEENSQKGSRSGKSGRTAKGEEQNEENEENEENGENEEVCY